MGIFKEILQNQVKKGLAVEGKNYIDPADKLKVQGQDIEVTQEVQTVKDIASGNARQRYRIGQDQTRIENVSNYSKLLTRLKGDGLASEETTKRIFQDINDIYGETVDLKKLKISETVRNATSDDMQNALMSAFKYNTRGTMSNKDFVLNSVNAYNIVTEFQALNKLMRTTTDSTQKKTILKNMAIHLSMANKITSALNQEIRTSAQKLAATRHGMKTTDIDFTSLISQVNRFNLDNLSETKMDQLGRMFAKFSSQDLMRVSDQITPTLLQKIFTAPKAAYNVIMELYYNSLLSGIPSQVINTFAGVVHLGKDKLDDVVASGVGAVRVGALKALGRNVTETDRLTFEAATNSDFADINAFKDAVALFNKIMITGEGSDGITKFDYLRKPAIRMPGTDGAENIIDVLEQFSQPGKINKITAGVNMLGILSRMSSRAMNAEDAFIKFFAKRRHLYQIAFQEAKENNILSDALQEGLSQAAAKQRETDYIKFKMDNAADRFTEQQLKEADEFAKTMTFQQELGFIGRGVQKIFQTPGLAFLAPFVKTPINIAKTTLNSTINVSTLVGPLMRKQGKEFDKAVAKLITGNAIMLSMVQLTSGMYGDDIKVTGGPHPDYKVRKYMREMNIPNYAIGFKQDDGSYKYIPFSRVDPISGILAMGADYNQLKYVMGAEGLEAMAQVMTLAVAEYVSDQPYMQGIAEFSDLIQRSKREKNIGAGLMQWAGGQTAKVIGTTLSGLNPLGIPIGNSFIKLLEHYEVPVIAPASSYYRSIVRGESKPREDTTFMGSIEDRSKMGEFLKAFYDTRNQLFAQNPQFNERFFPQKGMFYKDVGAAEHFLFGYEHTFLPFRVQTSNPDDVEKELQRLALTRDSVNYLGLDWDTRHIQGVELNKNMRDRYGQLWSQLDGNNKLPGQKGYDETDDLKGVMRSVIQDKEYKTLSSEEQFIAIKRVYDDRKNMAIRRLTEEDVEFPELYKKFEEIRRERILKQLRAN